MTIDEKPKTGYNALTIKTEKINTYSYEQRKQKSIPSHQRRRCKIL